MENQELIEHAKKLKEYCGSKVLGSECIFANEGKCGRGCMIADCLPTHWEIPNKIELTEDEKVILSNLDERYKWTSRDKNGSAWIYEEKPSKKINEGFWNHSGRIDSLLNLDVFPNLFKWLSWEDDEPIYIPDLLKGE